MKHCDLSAGLLRPIISQRRPRPLLRTPPPLTIPGAAPAQCRSEYSTSGRTHVVSPGAAGELLGDAIPPAAPTGDENGAVAELDRGAIERPTAVPITIAELDREAVDHRLLSVPVARSGQRGQTEYRQLSESLRVLQRIRPWLWTGVFQVLTRGSRNTGWLDSAGEECAADPVGRVAGSATMNHLHYEFDASQGDGGAEATFVTSLVALFLSGGWVGSVFGPRSECAGVRRPLQPPQKNLDGGCDATENRSNGLNRPGGAGWPPRSFAWARAGRVRWHRSRRRR